MAEHIEIAAHHPRPGWAPVELHGGPWDGQIAGVQNPNPPVIVINGPGFGHHYVWIMHRMSGAASDLSMCGPRWPTSKRVR